jgi:hypothetical protein
MKRIIRVIFTIALASAFVFSCSDGDDPDQNPGPNPPPPPPGGDVTITSTSGGDLFWGEEMTITGTGFSATKEENIVKFANVDPPISGAGCSLKYTSVEGDIEIVSASATQIKIKVPAKRNTFGDVSCGPRKANIEVTVGGKSATSEEVEFAPLPYIGGFLYHYGWFDVPSVTRIGDSVMISGGLIATPPKTTKYWDKVRLSINGDNMPIKFRTIGLESGWAFYLSVEEFAEVNCSEEPDGWGAREMEFMFSIDGTDKSASRMLYVQYLPAQVTSCDVCPSPLSKIAGGNPEWIIRGQNMNWTEVRFSPIEPCSGASQGMSITGTPWTDEIKFTVPLSILTGTCAYTVHLANSCQTTYIGDIGIDP